MANVDSFVGIESAMVTHLKAMTPVIDIARPNVNYTPAHPTPYQEVFLLPGRTANPEFGDQANILEEHAGIFQISLHYPSNQGSGHAFGRAGEIKNHFKRGLTLTATNGVIVHIHRTSSIGPAFAKSGGWFVVPVSVPYYSHILS